MKKILLAGLAVAALAVGLPTAAQADHTGYRGGCSFATINDTTPDGTLGGQNQWNGEINVVVVATDAAGTPTPDQSISAECELYINGNYIDTPVSATGTGAAAGGGQFSFTAEATDVVTLCDKVLVDGEPHFNCDDATTTQIVPQPVIDALDAVFALLISLAEQIDAIIYDIEVNTIDPVLCEILKLLYANGVTGVPGVLEIINDQGDVFLLGEPFWDCPPYDLFPPDEG